MDPNQTTAGMPEGSEPSSVRLTGAIDRYHLLGIIGEGGFGIVYEAEQHEPVRRRVALKVIKPGMDSKAVVARFEAERQALAVMDHPCIARIYDGGITAPSQGSRPYFVMELVRGDSITEHCDKQRLSIGERVALLAMVCDAVQHAHAKGVVHRDLKPSNILVAFDAEGRATPKVIDFGIAKALNQRLSPHTVYTELGQMIGTLEYMSPEQAEKSGQDIDTRSDVYSLGVVLYELLTGMLPFDSRVLRSAAYNEIQRLIREVNPPKPSTRLSTLLSSGESAQDAQRIVRARQSDPRAITGVLRRDLDWVVMRCLAKERERRYQTVSGLAEELRRFLSGIPVEAGPPSALYKAEKFFRRHRIAVSSAILSVVVLAGLVVVLSALLRSVREQRDRGERLIAFLESSTLTPPLLEDAGRNATVWDVLESSAGEASEQFADDPPVRARVLSALGSSRLLLGDEAGAAETLGLAAAAASEFGLRDEYWASRAAIEYADALGRIGQYNEATASLDGLLQSPVPRTAAEAATVHASLLKWRGNLDAAGPEYERAIELWTALVGADGLKTLEARYDLALVALERGKAARNAGDTEQADLHYRSSLIDMQAVLADQRRALGADHPKTLITVLEAATLHSRLGEFGLAEELFGEAIRGLTRRLGASHWRTLQAKASLGSLRYRQKDFAGAVEIYTPVFAAYRATGRLASNDAFVVAKARAIALAELGQPIAGLPELIEVHAAAEVLTTGPSPEAVADEIAALYERAGDENNSAAWKLRGTRETDQGQ